MRDSRKERFEMKRTAIAIGSSPAAPAEPGKTENTPPAAGDPQNSGSNSGDANQPPANGATQSEVEKAYGKLREVEGRERQLKKQAEDATKENTDLKSQNETLAKENATLKSDMQKFAAERLAQLKGFPDPESAVAVLQVRGVDLSDQNKAEKALAELAEEKKVTLSGPTPPSGAPINGQNAGTPADMNAYIRQAAGRGA